MQNTVTTSIREIIGLTVVGTLVLFFLGEIVLAQDVFFAHPVFVLAGTIIAITLWYWGKEHRVT